MRQFSAALFLSVSLVNSSFALPLPAVPIAPSGAPTQRPLANKLADTINVKDFGALGDGVTDDTAAINAAAAAIPNTGGVLLLPRGNFAVAGTTIYNAILVHSSTTVRCEGATITAIGPNANTLGLIQNIDLMASTLTDHDIRVTGCNFVFPNWVAGQPGKAMNFWFTSHVTVDNNTQIGGANMTAMIGSYDTLTTGNRAYGVTNAAYDHFSGGGRHRVIGNFAEVAPNPGGNDWGIQATGGNIANTPTPMDDILIDDNTIVYDGCASTVGAPIGVNGYSGGTMTHVTVTHNHLTNACAGNVSPGIYLSNNGQKTIADNTIVGAGAPSIFEDPGQSVGTTRDTIVEGNMLSGCGYNPVGYWPGDSVYPYNANIMLTGFNNTVHGNRTSGCTGQLVSTTQPSSTIETDNDDGTGTVPDVVPGFVKMGFAPQTYVTVTGTNAATAAQITSPTTTVSGGTGGAILPNTTGNGRQVIQAGAKFVIINATAAWTLYPSADTGILGGATSWTIATGTGTAPTVAEFTLVNIPPYGFQWMRTR
jgi:hypothetical protein